MAEREQVALAGFGRLGEGLERGLDFGVVALGFELAAGA